MRYKLWQLGIGITMLAPWRALAAPASANTAQCQGLKDVAGDTECSSNAAGTVTLTGKVGDVINTLFLVAGAIAVIIIIVAGIRYITSTGDSSRVQTAKDALLYAVIGLVVVILARMIVGFVIGQIA